MEWQEALPLLRENHTGVAISVTPKGRAQSTIVSTAVLDGKLGFASRDYTVKAKNIQRTGRAAVTVIKLDTRRYVTVEGPGVHRALAGHAGAYQASERPLRRHGPSTQGHRRGVRPADAGGKTKPGSR